MHNEIRIFFTNTKNVSTEVQQRIFNSLPIAQKNKAIAIGNQKRQKEFIVGRALLVQALYSERRQQNLPLILEKDFSAPIVHGLDDFYVSISHSKDLICCVLHTSPIGVDIEYKKNVKNIMDKSDFFMSHEELIKLHEMACESQKESYFYEVWCAKEAFFKSFDHITQTNTSLKSIQLSQLLQSNEYILFDKEINNYHLSMVYQDILHSVSLISVDLECYLPNS
ncbi:4'-phosphopantetheinyl transferase superfamily protein [Marinomonas sp. 5E14-1]|uniref:4'-phosphopantetheinyl transferase family protein n=1 Tax=Marinomonas sp. 5E14-1 TaxID=3153922 RepID=UPI0032654621